MIIVSFDTDHMTEHMLAVFLRDIMPKDLPATFFCDKPFACLAGAPQELAMHPFLSAGGPWIDITDRLRDDLSRSHGTPPRGLRPHSLSCSQSYVVDLRTMGFEYISSVSVPSAQEITCYRYPWGLVEIPVRYMDNMDLWARDKTGQTDQCFAPRIIEEALAARGVFCFDFHPVHIFLNTSHFGDYEAWVRDGRPELLRPVERADYGTRDFFLDVCGAATRSGAEMRTCLEAARLTA